TDVIRRGLYLQLIEGVHRNGLGAGLAAEGAGEAEGVVEVGAINGDVVHSGVGAGEAQTVGRRFEFGKILDRAADGGQLFQLGPVELYLRTRVGVVEDGVLPSGRYGDGSQLFRVGGHGEVTGVVLADG